MPSLARTQRSSLDAPPTAVTATPNGDIVIGSRGGILSVLDKHGSIQTSMDLGSWVGAAKVMHATSGETYVLAGTKRGALHLLQVQGADPPALVKLGSFSARNTIRSIDTWTSKEDGDEKIFFAVGSENRHVYIGELAAHSRAC